MSINKKFWIQVAIIVLLYLMLLPVVPNKAIGLHHAINPHDIVKLTLAIITIATIGNMLIYSARFQHAFLFTGFLGGFTSSTATVIAMANLAKQQPSVMRNAAAAASASNVATYLQSAMLIGFISPALLKTLAIPLSVGALVAALLSWAIYKKTEGTSTPQAVNVSFLSTIKKSVSIVLMLSMMLVAIAYASDVLGHQGVNAAAFLSGLVDGHASAISISELVSLNIMPLESASVPVLIGLTSNSIMRSLFSMVSKNRWFMAYVAGSLLMTIFMSWLVFLALQVR